MKEDSGSARTSLCSFIETNKPGKSGLNPLKSAQSYQVDPCVLEQPLGSHVLPPAQVCDVGCQQELDLWQDKLPLQEG